MREAPVPRQQRGEIGDLVIGDAGEYVGEPGLRIDVIELGRLNQREHDRGAFAAAIGAGEQLLMQMRPSSRKRVNASVRLSM